MDMLRFTKSERAYWMEDDQSGERVLFGVSAGNPRIEKFVGHSLDAVLWELDMLREERDAAKSLVKSLRMERDAALCNLAAKTKDMDHCDALNAMLNKEVEALRSQLADARRVKGGAVDDGPKAAQRLNDLAKMANDINRANGWNVITPEEWDSDPYRIPGVIALIHSEVSEALEAYRDNDRTHFAEELADVIIRTLDCAGGLGIDIEKEVLAKLEKNRGRGYRHGGKKV